MNAPIKNSSSEERRKPGRLPRSDMRLTSLMLDEDLLEWAKAQPGGLSETVRQLLRGAMESRRPE